MYIDVDMNSVKLLVKTEPTDIPTGMYAHHTSSCNNLQFFINLFKPTSDCDCETRC